MLCKAVSGGFLQERGPDEHLAADAPQSSNGLGTQAAIIRPGPIQGDMVRPWLQRRTA
jgi:DNA polymerase III alpha subunit